ncbi:anti-anti-sigma regulatory factor (antagonist of anti-sigma factor) [Herbaspirillum sp. CF444]|uniref:STAS domain-containing protein n=1 Tax=Herbaspirillum sp. CF444 TaxID=1144319 RepID=UPI0002724BFE|nr:STAS domain-containing protein [Herbaspirillum sp. CF444]EJL86711.1 anti-anti-sigma regulatory factor (antagonist of anti-sigma factor) [Herbaspirillum sp. CF444]
MPLTQSTRDGHLRLLVNGGFTIFQAAEYKPQLLGVIDNADEMLEMDLSGVDEIDTTGLQLLLLMKREAALQYKQLFFNGISPAVQNVIDMLHLQGTFDIQPSIQGLA